MADEKKIGLYIWSGDGIADAVDLEKLTEELKGSENVALVKVVDNLFSKEGEDLIKADIEAEELNGVVIGGDDEDLDPAYPRGRFRSRRDAASGRYSRSCPLYR